jgi:hypothetical protein
MSLIFVQEALRTEDFWEKYEKLLLEVLNNNRYAEYYAASLAVYDDDSKEIYIGCVGSIDKTNATDTVRHLLAQLYVKHKTPNHSYWELSQEILNKAA